MLVITPGHFQVVRTLVLAETMTARPPFDDKQPTDEGEVPVETALSYDRTIERTNGLVNDKSSGDSQQEIFTPASANAGKVEKRDEDENEAAPDTPSSRSETLILSSHSFEDRQTLYKRQTPPNDRVQTPYFIPTHHHL